MKTIDTRDLYQRQQELQSLKDYVGSTQEELTEAEKALAAFDPDRPNVAPDDEAWYEKKEELETAVEDAQTALDDAKADFGTDEQEELDELDELENEISDWRHGETMIPESDFEDYARELAEDIGAIPDENRWPCTYIDWERAARELAMDYTTVSYQGDDYYVRS